MRSDVYYAMIRLMDDMYTSKDENGDKALREIFVICQKYLDAKGESNENIE